MPLKKDALDFSRNGGHFFLIPEIIEKKVLK